MNGYKNTLLFIVFLLISSVSLYGQYKLKTGAFSSGAVINAASDGMFLNAAAGQTFIGVSQNDAYIAGSGFWYQLRPLLTSVDEPINDLPKTFQLYQNYPNPFNPVTRVKFALPKTARVRIDVYNILGQRVATLLNERKEAGYYKLTFNAAAFPSGLYLCTITANEFSKTIKMLLVK